MAKGNRTAGDTSNRDETAPANIPTAVTHASTSLEVVCDWRRQATAKQLERLWGAMELGREPVEGTVGDDVLLLQRDLFTSFATAVLGADAPKMEV